MKPGRLFLLLAPLLLFAAVAAPGVRAHEPLWGETPQTFSFGVLHPETRLGWESESRLYRGGSRVANPEGLRMSRQESLVSLQYAPKPTLNVRLEVPYVRVVSEQRVGGSPRRTNTSGLGDLMLSAKSRFRAGFGPNWKSMHAYTVGLQLPTGEHSGREPDGALLAPSEQPGTGNWGVMGKDRIDGRGDDDSGHRSAGLQATLIATKNQYQGRVGVLVPVYRHYNGTQLGAGVQFRAGFEALF